MKKTILYGNTILTRMILLDEIACGLASFAAVAVDHEYLQGDSFCGLPQIDVALLSELYSPEEFDLLAVLGGYSRVRSRAEFFTRARVLGYSFRNYISPRADVSKDLELGLNNIIMSQSYVGPCSTLGDDNLVRQNVYLGHDLLVGDHNVFGPGCNIGGHGKVGSSCYVCMGSTVIDSLTLADETLIGAGSVVIRSTEAFSENVGNPSRVIGYHREEGIRMDPSHG